MAWRCFVGTDWYLHDLYYGWLCSCLLHPHSTTAKTGSKRTVSVWHCPHGCSAVKGSNPGLRCTHTSLQPSEICGFYNAFRPWRQRYSTGPLSSCNVPVSVSSHRCYNLQADTTWKLLHGSQCFTSSCEP